MERAVRLLGYFAACIVTVLPIVTISNWVLAFALTPISFIVGLLVGEHLYNYICRRFIR